MQANDWLDRWQQNRIGFHQGEVNASLQRFIGLFKLNAGDRVFLPLCGKAHDIAWLAARGFEVIGIELSSIAVEAFFAEFNLQYQRYESDRFNVYESDNIVLYQGDYFDLNARDLAGCKLVYDRAALIAIDADNRGRYCSQMKAITPSTCNMLLITLEYDQSVMSGPPFSVFTEEVIQQYADQYEIDQLLDNETVDESPRWREQGLVSLREKTFQLMRKKSA